MNLDEPVDQLRPDGLLNLLLSRHVGGIGIPLRFIFQHVGVDVLAELGHVVDVVHSASVSPSDLIENLVLAPLVEHLQFLMQRNARQFVSGGGSEAADLGFVSVFEIHRRVFPLGVFLVFNCNSADRSHTSSEVGGRMNSLSGSS